MKKNNLILLSVSIFTATILIIVASTILPVLGVPGNTTSFNVTLTVNSGSPSITYVQAISDSPNEGGTKLVHFYFNATHPNGVANIPASGAHVQINQSGTIIPDNGCIINSTDGSALNRYDCNITIYYYTLPGTWTINATITDISSNKATNNLVVYTNGNTYGVALKTNSISFGGTPGATNIPANENPQYVNNTGNMNFTQINLTAYSLQSGSNVIGAGNFTANTTNSGGPGQQLLNNTPITLSNSSVSLNNSRNLYLYANIPIGIANGTYNSTGAWVVTLS
jgi:hypothetical protein